MHKTPPHTSTISTGSHVSVADGSEPFRVVIAGGGVAGVEAALALRDLARDRVALTIVAPNPELVYRPMAVLEPFAYAPARGFPLAEIAEDLGVNLIVDRLEWVDAQQRTAHTQEGQALGYDALVIAMGARAVGRFAHAVTIDDRRMDELLHGLIQDVEGGFVQSIAFVVPARMAWPLPIYELALMTARRAYEMCMDLNVVIVTPEDAPLAIFGRGASTGVAELLDQAGIEVISSAYVQVPHAREVVIQPHDRRLQVDRIVALPELYGPALHGPRLQTTGSLPWIPTARSAASTVCMPPATEPTSRSSTVASASQQADVVALSVAALAGAPVVRERFQPLLRGILLTGAKPKYLTARITGGAGFGI